MNIVSKVWVSAMVRWAVAIMVAFFLGVLLHSLKPSSVHTQSNSPAFTVTTIKKWDTGLREAQMSTIEAFAPDGSTAKWTNTYWPAIPGKPAGHDEVRHLKLVRSQAFHLVIPEAESVSTFPLSSSEVGKFAKRRECGPSSREGPASGPSSILGFRVVKETLEIDGGSPEPGIIERWLAPELNCYPLRLVIQKRDRDGNLRAMQTIDTASVVLGEPDPKLFAVPANYTERSPAAAAAELALRRGQKPPIPSAGLLQWEEKYYQSRSQ